MSARSKLVRVHTACCGAEMQANVAIIEVPLSKNPKIELLEAVQFHRMSRASALPVLLRHKNISLFPQVLSISIN